VENRIIDGKVVGKEEGERGKSLNLGESNNTGRRRVLIFSEERKSPQPGNLGG